MSVANNIRPTPTIEDYLAVMYVMLRDDDEIIAARLAETLEVAAPTVAVTLKRMERDGWIINQGRKGIFLTDSGLEAARSVIRRHMLTEWMLARMLKVPWSRIHEEAHQIEHTISDDIEARMQSNLDDPHLCPHGNPLPGYEYITMDWIPLTEVAPAETVTIRRIHEKSEYDPTLLSYLEEKNLLPGTQIKVCEVLPFNQTITIMVHDQEVILGFKVAQFIYADKAA